MGNSLTHPCGPASAIIAHTFHHVVHLGFGPPDENGRWKCKAWRYHINVNMDQETFNVYYQEYVLRTLPGPDQLPTHTQAVRAAEQRALEHVLQAQSAAPGNWKPNFVPARNVHNQLLTVAPTYHIPGTHRYEVHIPNLLNFVPYQFRVVVESKDHHMGPPITTQGFAICAPEHSPPPQYPTYPTPSQMKHMYRSMRYQPYPPYYVLN